MGKNERIDERLVIAAAEAEADASGMSVDSDSQSEKAKEPLVDERQTSFLNDQTNKAAADDGSNSEGEKKEKSSNSKEDKKERKKEQNRLASQRFRQRQRQIKELSIDLMGTKKNCIRKLSTLKAETNSITITCRRYELAIAKYFELLSDKGSTASIDLSSIPLSMSTGRNNGIKVGSPTSFSYNRSGNGEDQISPFKQTQQQRSPAPAQSLDTLIAASVPPVTSSLPTSTSLPLPPPLSQSISPSASSPTAGITTLVLNTFHQQQQQRQAQPLYLDSSSPSVWELQTAPVLTAPLQYQQSQATPDAAQYQRLSAAALLSTISLPTAATTTGMTSTEGFSPTTPTTAFARLDVNGNIRFEATPQFQIGASGGNRFGNLA